MFLLKQTIIKFLGICILLSFDVSCIGTKTQNTLPKVAEIADSKSSPKNSNSIKHLQIKNDSKLNHKKSNALNDKKAEEKTNEPAEKKAEEKSNEPAEKKAGEKSNEPAEKKAGEKSNEPAEKKAGEKSNEPAEKKAEEKSNEPAEKKAEEKPNEPAEKKAEEKPNEPAEKKAEEKPNEPAEKKAEEKPNEPAEKKAEEKPNEPAEKKAEEKPNEPAEKKAEEKPNEPAEKKAEEKPNEPAEKKAEEKPNEPAEKKAGEKSKVPAEKKAGEKSKVPAEKKAEEKPNEPAEKKAEEKPNEPAEKKAGEKSKVPAEKKAGEKSKVPAEKKAGEKSSSRKHNNRRARRLDEPISSSSNVIQLAIPNKPEDNDIIEQTYLSKELKRIEQKKRFLKDELKRLKEFQNETSTPKKDYEITLSSNLTIPYDHPDNPFTPIVDYEYIIGIGDVLEIHVWNHPELSSQHTVGPDGVITLPVIGDFKIQGLTRSVSTEKVSILYDKYYPNVIVNIKVVAYNSIVIYTLGNIARPGPVTMNRLPKLLELVSQVGGVTQGRNAFIPSCAIIRGRDAIAWIDLNSLIHGSDLRLNFDLKPNDVIHFSDWEVKPIFLLGEVNRAGPQTFKPGMSILDAITNVGGITRNANRKAIYLIRPDKEQKIKLRYDDLLKPDLEFNLELQPGDIIMIPPNWLSKFNYVISTLNPLSWWAFSTGTATAPGVEPNASIPR